MLLARREEEEAEAEAEAEAEEEEEEKEEGEGSVWPEVNVRASSCNATYDRASACTSLRDLVDDHDSVLCCSWWCLRNAFRCAMRERMVRMACSSTCSRSPSVTCAGKVW